MLKYKYTARDTKTGQKVKANVDAQDQHEAIKLIRQEGLVPLSVVLSSEARSSGLLKYFNRVSSKDRVLFSRQLSTLINAGLPLVQSLRSVADQTESKPLKAVINEIIADVEGGASLSKSMEKHTQVFNKVYLSLVAAGETSGTLDNALERLADQQEKDANILSKIRGAMIYPIIVLLVMMGVITFMMVKVLPQVENLYNSLPGANLPILTRILIGTSHFIINNWWIVLLFIGLLIFFTSRYAKSVAGRKIVDKVKMKAGPLGPLFMKLYMARFSRTASTLVASGVPLLQVLDVTGQAISNVHIENSLKKASEKIRGGKSLSEAIKNDPNFLPLVPNMIGIGEQSGTMEQMLGKSADYYEHEVDTAVANISALIEPILMVILGVVALLIVAAVLLPIYGLASSSSLNNI